jgi:S1-C subfamily serine protease
MKRTIAVVFILFGLATAILLWDARSPYDRAIPSTVWIEMGEARASGVLVGEDLVLTARFAISDDPKMRVHFPIRERGNILSSSSDYSDGVACIIVAEDMTRDLALLRIEGKGRPIPLAERSHPGDLVFAIASGETLFAYMSGRVQQVFNRTVKFTSSEFKARVIETDDSMGMNGAPLINDRGELAGIMSSLPFRPYQYGMAIDVGEIRDFLKGVK